jgi:hypothetical protein
MGGRVFVFIDMDMPRDRDALHFLADFKSFLKVLFCLKCNYACTIQYLYHLQFHIFIWFAKKYQFYSSALVASLHLGRETWKNVNKQIKAAVSSPIL